MAAKRDKKRREEHGEGEVSDGEDGSVASRASSASSSSEELISPDAGDKIRQNARELLQAAPDRPGQRAAADAKAHGYQSYHDAATASAPSFAPAGGSGAAGTAATPPWEVGQTPHDAGLGVTDVASLAFSCVAQCLTEGYRAASSYYGGYDDNQFPSVSGTNESHNYQQVAGRYNGNGASDSYNGSSNGDGNGDGHGGSNGVTSGNGNGGGGYQTKFSDDPSGYGEVMDRSAPRRGGPASSGRAAEERPQPAPEAKDEWATVQVPSTYQGGRAGN